MNTTRSRELFRARPRGLPGRRQQPRPRLSRRRRPAALHRARPGRLPVDVDGNRFIDYVLSWGPLILGHAHPAVVAALQAAAAAGTSYGAPCPAEVELARPHPAFMPGMEMMRFVNSGTEATMSALRLARAFTGRERIVKFEGGYHGHADMLLVKAGSGVATLGLPDSPGVPAGRRRGHPGGALQRPGGGERLVEANPAGDRGHHRGAGGRQHGGGAAGAGLPGRPAPPDQRARAPC